MTLVTTKKNDPAFAAGYEVRNLLSNGSLRYVNPFIFFTIRRLIKEKKATHLILEHPYYGWLGRMLKFFCGVKLIVHSHNIEGNRWKTLGKWWWKILWNYERSTHRHADYNFFIQDEDRKYAIKEFGLKENKCCTVSFGTELSSPPQNNNSSSQLLRQQLHISADIPLLLFNGSFRYGPNLDALENILFKVNPLLQAQDSRYLILVIGIDIPESVKKGVYPGIRILGFAEDLELFLSGTNVFLNPVITGGGIKTKLVEALAFNLTSVSSVSGAIGIDPLLCNGKLLVSPDGDWEAFARSVLRAITFRKDTPAGFYDQFYWGNIAKKAAVFINNQLLITQSIINN